MEITIQGPDGPFKVQLFDTALISSFHTSVVSLKKFIAKNVHWNTEREALIYQGGVFCHVKPKHDQWVLEYSPLTKSAFAIQSSQPRPDKKGSAEVWHRRLGHIGPAAVQHLSESATGAKLVPGPKTIECEICSVSKAHQLIS